MITSEDIKTYKRVRKKILEVANNLCWEFEYDIGQELPVLDKEKIIFDGFWFPKEYVTLTKRQYFSAERKLNDSLESL